MTKLQNGTSQNLYSYNGAGTISAIRHTGEYRQTEGGDLSYYLSYDSNGNTVEKTAVDNAVRTITKGTDADGNAFVSNDGVTVTSEKDDFGRLSNVTITRENSNVDLKLEYTYLDGTNSNSTTNLVETLTQKLGTTTIGLYSYDYDENNNITYIYENGSSESSVEYEYDHLNQFTREIDYKNRTYTLSLSNAKNQCVNERALPNSIVPAAHRALSEPEVHRF